MLQILAVGMIGTIVSVSAERVLLARGDSFSHMIMQACQAALLLTGMSLGAQWLGGAGGILVGVSIGYVPLAIRRYGAWLPALDGLALAVSLVVVGGGLILRSAP